MAKENLDDTICLFIVFATENKSESFTVTQKVKKQREFKLCAP